MDVTGRLPDCDGQAADALSAHTQVKMEHAPRLLRIPKSECPDIWMRRPRHEWPNQGPTLLIQWFFLNENCTDTHLLASCGERQFEEVEMEIGWEKVPKWEMLLSLSRARIILFGIRG